MQNNIKIKRMTGIAMLSAIIVILQLISNYVTIGPVSITLSLIPIVIGAILYGPCAGAFLGIVNGFIVIFAPSTLSLFMPFNPWATVILCLLKMGAAGFVSGWIFRGLRKKNFPLSVILASVSVPLINTGLFALGTMAFFMPLVEQFAGEGVNVYQYLFLTFIGFNFIIELIVNSALSPALLYVVRIFARTHDIGVDLNA